MGLTFLHATQVTSPVTVVTTAETIVGLVGPLSENQGPSVGLGALIEATMQLTTTASASAVTVRVRQGNNVAGTLVAASGAIAIAASAIAQLSWSALDTSAFAFTPGVEYVVTVQMTGAAANTSVIGVFTAEDVTL